MPFAKARLLRHPLSLLAAGFILQMCAHNPGQNTPEDAGIATDAGTPEGGSCSKDGDCSLPPSRCSPSGNVLVYYTSPSCTNGTCSWKELQLPCACYNGGCTGSGTSGGAGVTTAGGITTAGGSTGGFGGNAGRSGAGGLGDADASDAADADGDADASLQACNSPSDCGLPSSYCKDSTTLVFAKEATCTVHLCAFAFSEVHCTCSGNGCVGTTTR
jgi:hypothetical protein